jgi:membrane protein DedA with SNARE-associated domain
VDQLVQHLLALVASGGLRGIALVLFVEELGVPSPAPGDLLMLFGGVLVAQGHANLATVLLVEELASMAGSTLLYWFSRRMGRPLVLQYGRYLGLGPERLAQTEARIRGRELAMIFGGRLIPGLRILTVVAAGVTDVPRWKFVPAVAGATLIYCTSFTMLGAIFGPPVLRLFTRVEFPAAAVWSLAGLALIMMSLRRLRRTLPERLTVAPPLAAELMGGLLAGIAGLLGANAAVALLEFAYRLTARPIGLGLTRPFGGLHFLLGWPVFIVAALTLSIAHRWLRVRQIPRSLRLTLTAAVPAVLTLLLLVRRLDGLAGAANSETANLIIVSTALIRWAIFGLVVELLPLQMSRPRTGRRQTA